MQAEKVVELFMMTRKELWPKPNSSEGLVSTQKIAGLLDVFCLSTQYEK